MSHSDETVKDKVGSARERLFEKAEQVQVKHTDEDDSSGGGGGNGGGGKSGVHGTNAMQPAFPGSPTHPEDPYPRTGEQ